MDILQLLQQRYTCKAYQPNSPIDEHTLATFLDCLRLTPSSINSQPWKFLVVKTPDVKQKIVHAMPDLHQHNVAKVLNSAVTIIFTAKTDIDVEHMKQVLKREFDDQRFPNEEAYLKRLELCSGFVQHYQATGIDSWVDNQLHIALGIALITAQSLGLDSTAIGGFNTSQLDEILELKQHGLRSVLLLTLGTASEHDFNRALPKSRFTTDDVIDYL